MVHRVVENICSGNVQTTNYPPTCVCEYKLTRITTAVISVSTELLVQLVNRNNAQLYLSCFIHTTDASLSPCVDKEECTSIAV